MLEHAALPFEQIPLTQVFGHQLVAFGQIPRAGAETQPLLLRTSGLLPTCNSVMITACSLHVAMSITAPPGLL